MICEDLAKAILFLAGNDAAFITGEYIAVNGGLYMRA
jgi:NAD(P)-dependent dehydrogenase (short-subunit alcohol dehydrogenase family)